MAVPAIPSDLGFRGETWQIQKSRRTNAEEDVKEIAAKVD
jgi:hypothetical protein